VVRPDAGNDEEIRRRLRGIAAVCTAFLMVAGAAVAVCVSDAFSTRHYRPFPQIGNTYRCLMAAELFFVIFLWPMAGARRGAVNVPALAGLVVVSAPLVAVAAYVSNVQAYSIALTHLLLLAVAAASISGCSLAGRAGGRAWRWYYFAAVFLSGGIPLLHFLTINLTGVRLPWVSCISPFWAMELVQQTAAASAKLYWAITVLIFTTSAAVMQKL